MLVVEEGVPFAIQLGDDVYEGGTITFEEGAHIDLVNFGRLRSEHIAESRMKNHDYL